MAQNIIVNITNFYEHSGGSSRENFRAVPHASKEQNTPCLKCIASAFVHHYSVHVAFILLKKDYKETLHSLIFLH